MSHVVDVVSVNVYEFDPRPIVEYIYKVAGWPVLVAEFAFRAEGSGLPNTHDSSAFHAEAWRWAFEHFGIEVGFDEAWRQIGKGGDKVTALFIPPSELARLEKPLKELRKDIFHQDYMARIVAFPRAGDLLRRVRPIGMTVAIATSANKQDLP